MNLIKVTQVRDEKKHFRLGDTLRNTLKEVFGEEVSTRSDGYHGVAFKEISDEGYPFYGNRLKGIQMTVGDYGNKTIRKVMVKNDMIDADAVKSKFAELKVFAQAVAKLREESANYLAKCEALRDKIAKAVNHPELGYTTVELRSTSPEAVKLECTITGTQLTAIEQLLGEQKVRIELIVPEALAVQVYNIMQGGT